MPSKKEKKDKDKPIKNPIETEDDFDNPKYFFNRELSWLQFNRRVLMEAENKDNPLFERMKFLSIVTSNLDEFFMIRVATLRDLVRENVEKPDSSGYTPKAQIEEISKVSHEMTDRQYAIYKSIAAELGENGLDILSGGFTEPQLAFLAEYFESEVYPVLTPMAVDQGRRFPLILNKSLNIGVLIDDDDIDADEDKPIFATVQVPAMLPRLVRFPDHLAARPTFVPLEDIISIHIGELFSGRKVLCAHAYRITRNADLSIEEEEAVDLLLEIKSKIKARKWGTVIRLEIVHDMREELRAELMRALEVTDDEVYPIRGPLNLDFLMRGLYGIDGFEQHKYKPFKPSVPQALQESEGDIFSAINNGDIILHHPYDSFDPVLQFIQQAARDPQVLAIKQTLYRVSGNSPIVKALAEGAERGKQITVLLEIKARFDEENNIQWGGRLEQAGCHVIYGLVGLKTHSKITLVVRREESGIRRYVHLGTGNYNDVTANIYTDFGLFTARDLVGADASAFFNMLSGFSQPPSLHRLVTAPLTLRNRFLELIEAEIAHQRSTGNGEIFAKMNSLVDTNIIKALYRASREGVKINLHVRGICCLRPGVLGVSENITVTSIVGRFLEHTRIYWFGGGGMPELYLSSADWMPRNLDRRVELLFPVEDARLSAEIMAIMDVYKKDTMKSWSLNADGTYTRVPPGIRFCAQDELIRQAGEGR